MARVVLVSQNGGAEQLLVPEPGDETAGRYFSRMHARSAAAWKAIAQRLADDPPESIEFDRPGLAAVTIQARVSGDPRLAETRIVARPGIVEPTVAASLEDRIDAEIERYALRNAECVAPGTCSGGPLVSVIIPYFKMSEFIERTVASVYAQDYRPLEVIVVNDGSFLPEDALLFELAERYPVELLSRPNGGLGSARNFGIAQSRGRYVLPLDADNVILPGFIERAVGVLEARPEVAYVTAWSTYIDPNDVPLGDDLGYQPIGNELRVLDAINVAGDALAVIPRSVFEDGFRYSEEVRSFEDRLLYRQLAARERYGVVIPERLINYRVREDSMFRSMQAAEREELLRRMDEIVEEGRVAKAQDAPEQLRRANLELSRELIDARTEIAAIRGSLRWRLLAPLEGWTKRFRREG